MLTFSQAPAQAFPTTAAPRVSFVSLGCPKALVDSERILTRLRAEGYELSRSHAGADVVVVNTCGFLDSAKAESLGAIGEAMAKHGRVIVTGCLGATPDAIRERVPRVLAITGPQAYEEVMAAVRAAAPAPHDPKLSLLPEQGLKLTPRHYSYLKISEGCNNSCSFCIIPQLRGRLASRPVEEVLREAERLVRAGVKELLVVSQDTSAYGVDLRHASARFRDREVSARFVDLARELGSLGAWVRLHYVYPYPHVDDVIPLMAEGLVLPYLDIPFQHASPSVLRAMKRPGDRDRLLDRIRRWRELCPELTIRSTFIVGFPGESDADFDELLDWLSAAKLDRVGAFPYEPVAGAPANDLALPVVPDALKRARHRRFMEHQRLIGARRLKAKVGRRIKVIVDQGSDGGSAGGGATGGVGRSMGDAPEIDGKVHLASRRPIRAGEIVTANVKSCDDYDLFADVG